MRCKTFSIPLASEAALDRERKLNDFLATANVKRVFASLASHPEGPIWTVLFLYDEGVQVTQKAVPNPEATLETTAPLTGEQAKSIVALKKWRADQAGLEAVPLYMVAQNKWLEDMVRMPVKTLGDLTKIRGLGEWRVQKYGAKIVETLNTVNAARRLGPSFSYPAVRA
jgi:superfamily II DNA helicase RecQ